MGKSHLVKYSLQKSTINLKKLVAVTTRKKRIEEKEGIDKYFLTNQQFRSAKENMVSVRGMYGAWYGFWAEDFDLKSNLIVELYYKDYLNLKKEGYPIKGIYIYTPRGYYRRNIVKQRYTDKRMFVLRELTDIGNHLIHKIMLCSGLFDYVICNYYDARSEESILNILESKEKMYDSSR